MNTVDKIKKSWWVLLSFIFFLNGFGFIYIALRHNNKNWLFEGIMYELPWIFYFILYPVMGVPAGSDLLNKEIAFALLLMLISIIRSIWVAIKLCDVYVDDEKPKVQYVPSNPQTKPKNEGKLSEAGGCCICVFFILFMFAIIAIL